MLWRREGATSTSIAAGTLDEPTGLRTVAHIFVDSKGDYYQLADELPRLAGSGQPASEGVSDVNPG